MVENEQISNGSCQRLLGVFFDSKLTFQSHIDNICKTKKFQKSSQKLNTISGITPYIDFNRKNVSCKCFLHDPV